MTALVLLGSTSEDAAAWVRVRAGLPVDVTVLAPSLRGHPGEVSGLEPAVARVSASLAKADQAHVTVCGVGLGALVALSLAASTPGQVHQVALITRQRAVPTLPRSLSSVALQLMPATVAARLGLPEAQVAALLDQARPVDSTPLARRVSVPATVLCGANDRLNRRSSEALARSLPNGRLQLVAAAGTGWLTSSPQLLAEALLPLLG